MKIVRKLEAKKYTLTATATMGLESIVAKELKDIGMHDIKTLNGKVEFEGTATDVCIANLWLRCADRVLIKVAEFKALSFDELFDKTKAIPWSSYITSRGSFPVDNISSVKSKLYSKRDGQSIIKKAVVEALKAQHKVTYLPENGEKYPIRVQINKDIVQIYLDTSGSGLHRRGYRQSGEKAPIRETLAAGLIKIANWYGDKPLLDPTCGTGTLLIEAAMIAKNMAPGLNRSFCSEKWPIIPTSLWKREVTAAIRAVRDYPHKILGSDINYRALKAAQENIKNANVDDVVFVQKQDLVELSSKNDYGAIICNPPYGERIGTEEETFELYKNMGKTFKEKFPTWSYYIITSNEKFESSFGRKATKNRKLYNGGIKTYFYQYYSRKH